MSAVIDGVIDSAEQISDGTAGSFHEHDVRARRHRVGPFDVERNLLSPPGIGRRATLGEGLTEKSGGGRWQAEPRIERVEVGRDGRSVVSVHDRNRLSETV